MYKRKIKDNLENCGLIIAMRIFGAKWKPCIIDVINKGYGRPSEIHRQIPEATPRVLDIQLSELLEAGLVSRSTGTGFPLYSEYRLTELGKGVMPIVQQLNMWGSNYRQPSKDEHSKAV